MSTLLLGLLLTLVGRTMAQPALTIGANTRVVGSGAVQLVYGGGALTNNGALSLPAGQLSATGPVTYGGSGTATVATALFNHTTGSSTLNSLLSVTDRATLSANASVNANGLLYLRTDGFPNANLVNDGYLTGTVQGLVTKATVTSGSAPYTSQLSHNVSGSVMQYQWQSSADNSQWSNVPGATSAMYTASVNATTFYRCLLTATNTAYSQTTPAVQLVVTATKPVAPTLPNLTATVGTPFSYVVPAFTGTAPISYGASGLPDGLVFDPATRTIAGTPNTVQTPTVTITATNIAGQSSGQFTITVNPAPVVTNLTVLSRDPESGNLNTNTIKPYLLLQNDGTTPIPYGELTVRYWLTVENAVPLRFDINYAQMGNDKVHFAYVPLSPARQGASGYIEFSFDASAGSLGAGSNAVIQDLINKQDYSMFFQGDDYSYANNANFVANPRITAYRNGALVYGIEPATGPGGITPLTLMASASPTTILTTGSTTLSAQVSGGTPGYSYVFSGPGTIQASGNTATVSNLPPGQQTFTVTVTDATAPVNQTVSTTVSVQVTAPPVNQPPVPGANTNQVATQGVLFTYTANAFSDETPNSLTYTASFNPANNLTFNPATRMIQGTPGNTGVTSVTITATDPGGLSASTLFTITVSAAPVVGATQLTVLSRDPDNGQLSTNTLKPYLQLQNDGSTGIPYSEITVRYWLTVENPVPLRFDINYAQMGNDKVHLSYVPISPARQGATGYIEFSFDASAGSLGAGSNAVIQDLVNKQDYSYFNQGDDYSYRNTGNFTANAHITAYRNGVLIYGTEPPTGARLSAENADAPLMVRVLGNPLSGGEMTVDIQGAAGQSLRLRVTDLAGHLVSEQAVERAGAQERQRLGVGRASAGLLFLQVSTPTQSQTVKVLKAD